VENNSKEKVYLPPLFDGEQILFSHIWSRFCKEQCWEKQLVDLKVSLLQHMDLNETYVDANGPSPAVMSALHTILLTHDEAIYNLNVIKEGKDTVKFDEKKILRSLVAFFERICCSI